MKYFLILISSVYSITYGQIVKVKEIRLKPNARYYNTKEKTIIYPIIITSDKSVDSVINSQIKVDAFGMDTENQSIKKVLYEHINDYGLINLSYDVTYNNNGLLSFSIYSEGCGAYCSSGETYFNFDTKTGRAIGIKDLIINARLDSFRNIVFIDKLKALNEYKIEEKGNLLNPNIDSVTINWSLEQVEENCITNVDINDFSLSSSNLEIKDVCEFPHAIRSQQPAYELNYSYSIISYFLKPKFKRILMK